MSPVLRSLEPEILRKWANGVLTRGIAEEYQFEHREQAEFMIWRFAAPLVREALRLAQLGIVVLLIALGCTAARAEQMAGCAPGTLTTQQRERQQERTAVAKRHGLFRRFLSRIYWRARRWVHLRVAA